MTEESTVTAIAPQGTEAQEVPESTASPDKADEAQNQETKELKKQLEHLEQTNRTLQGEKDKDRALAREEADKARDEQLAKLTDLATAQASKAGAISNQEEYDQMIKEINEGGGEATVRVMEARERLQEKDFQKRLEEQETRFKEQMDSSLDEKVSASALRMSESYRNNKERIDEYRKEYGVSEEGALKMLTDFNTEAKLEEASPAMQTANGVARVPSTTETPKMTDAQKEQFEGMGFSAEEMKAWEEQQKIKAGAKK